MRTQGEMLQHFNGIFGSFSIINDNTKARQPSIYGPITALDISSKGYSYNTNSENMDCKSHNHMLRLGFMAKNSNVQGDIYGGILTKNGTVDTKSNINKCASHSSFHPINRVDDLLDSLWSFAPTTIKKTSRKLASFAPDTIIGTDRTLTSSSSNRSFDGYRILKLPACSDSTCATMDKATETTMDVLKGAYASNKPYISVPKNEMVVFNIPVYVGGVFTISTLDVNKNISPCQAIFNFYPVDRSGNYVNDPNATFILIRSSDVTIAGTILAPQANIVDAPTGYFGGQLITLKSYEGHGADIKDFKTVSNGTCSSRSLCWPIDHAPRVVTEVVTVSATKTFLSTIIEDQNTLLTSKGPKKAAVVATATLPDTTVTETVDLIPNYYRVVKKENGANVSRLRPQRLLDGDVSSVVDGTTTEEVILDLLVVPGGSGTVDDMEMFVVDETNVLSITRTHYENVRSTTTDVVEVTKSADSVALVTEVLVSTVIPQPDSPVIPIDATITPPSYTHWHHHKYHDKNKHGKWRHDWHNKDKEGDWNEVETYDERVNCYLEDAIGSTICYTHINEEFPSIAPWAE